MSDVVIVDSGVANLASIAGAFRRLNAGVIISADPATVRDAARIVLPGVGAFGTGMAALRSRGLETAIRDHGSRGTPILGICLGMQMLCEASEEAPGVAGLGVVAGTCRRLPPHVRIPHLGWNSVTPEPEARLLTPGSRRSRTPTRCVKVRRDGPPPGPRTACHSSPRLNAGIRSLASFTPSYRVRMARICSSAGLRVERRDPCRQRTGRRACGVVSSRASM